MKKSRILTLALAAAVLAVVASSSVQAATWNMQSDVTEYRGTPQATWYTWIDTTGSATTGYKVSWNNGLNDKVSVTVKPKIFYMEDLNHDGYYPATPVPYSGTLNLNQAWNVLQYTQGNVQSGSAHDIYVDHDYLDYNGVNTLGSSGYKMHYFNY